MSSSGKKVSIVVPVYNREKFLDKCITSLTNQTYKNIEIILVDDGSKDKSYDVCCSYAKNDSRIKVVHKENGGVQSARNRGIDEATGYYLCFTDADDYVSEKFVENFVKVFDSGSYECVVCGFYKVDQDYNVLLKNDNLINLDIPTYESERWALYFERFGCYVWNHMFITDIVRKYNVRFDKDIIIFDDTAFSMNYLNHIDSIGFTNSNDYYYVSEHDDLTVAKRLKNKRVNDGGCREKAKTCILKHEKYLVGADIIHPNVGTNFRSPCRGEHCEPAKSEENLRWVSSALYHIAMVSFILYISRVPYDYRYSKEEKDRQFDESYEFFKSKNLDTWYYNYNDLQLKLKSINLLRITEFFFFKTSKKVFRLFCDIFGNNTISNIFLYLRKIANKS